ncbi:MAG: M48 family metallopeptidase [Lachnospiraceae bacterium]|nr:M48 family metallopeptidase [Lachnospiraceae bacterium]
MALEVTADGRVILRAPYRMPDVRIEQFLKEKASWIEKSLDKVSKRREEESGLEKLSADDIRRLADQALTVIPSKAAYYAEQIGVSYGRITIRNQKSRWGSCSAKGNLNFNCLLMLTPEKVQDYVVVHELCHRKEMNHSQRFWSEVERILPDYKERRRWLKEHGGSIIRSMG